MMVIVFLGWTSLLTFERRENLVATMLLFEIIWKRQTAINQLADGLKKNDVLLLIRKYPGKLKEKFVAINVKLTSEQLLNQMIWSGPDNELEERAKKFLIEYLNLEGDITIGDGRSDLITRHLIILFF